MESDLQKLLGIWLNEDDATPGELALLTRRLKEDPAFRKAFIAELSMLGKLRVVQSAEPRWRKLEDAIGGASELREDEDAFEQRLMDQVAEVFAEEETREARGAFRRRPPFQPWWFLGAVTLALLVGMLIHFADRGEGETGIGRVIRLEGTNPGFPAGTELMPGDTLVMDEGLIELAFHETGVHLIAAAPLNLRIDNEKRICLFKGEARLHVPPQGIGFVVDTVARQITDLGPALSLLLTNTIRKCWFWTGKCRYRMVWGGRDLLMAEGDHGTFRSSDQRERLPSISGDGEALASINPAARSLPGVILGFKQLATRSNRPEDLIDHQLLPLVQSGFKDLPFLDNLKRGKPLRFAGIAGSYTNLPIQSALAPYDGERGWVAWYSGELIPPRPGRYRFWGYADNHLVVAMDGTPVFEGSRYDSRFRDHLSVPRSNHPSLPCLSAKAGFASGPWIEVGEEPVRIDLLFGERSHRYGLITSGLLLIEQEGKTYEETSWGQPKWPLFLTEPPAKHEIKDWEKLQSQLEQKLQGSFSLPVDSIWRVSNPLAHPASATDKPTPPAHPKLVAHWKLDDQGYMAMDSAGSNHGTIIGAIPASGVSGKAFEFAREDRDYIEIPYSEELELSTFTISSWVYLTTPPVKSGILGTRHGGDCTFDLKVQSDNIHGDLGNGNYWINVEVDIGAGDTGSNGRGGKLELQRWYHIVYVVDHSDKQCRLYLDGDLKKEIAFEGTPVLMTPSSTMHIGNSHPRSITTEYMDGRIDELKIWNHALTKKQIETEYLTHKQ